MQSTQASRNVLATLLALAVVLTGCATPRAVATPDVEPAPEIVEPAPGPVRVAIIGDSITSWDPPYAGDPAQSWVFTATSNEMPLVGGWALPGASIGDMADHLEPVDADVFLIMAGTNDLPIKSHRIKGTPVADRIATLDQMVARVTTEHVIVLAVAPFGFDHAVGVEWNAHLREYAAARGFAFVDPWVHVRDASGGWLPGADRGDGVHPSPATATHVGNVISNAIAAVATQPTSPPVAWRAWPA